MDKQERRRQFELRTCYRQAWDILTTWATCRCTLEACPLEAEMTRLGFTPGDLLAAVALGQPHLIGLTVWPAP